MMLVPVQTKNHEKLFIDLQWKLYSSDKKWVPQLKMSIQEMFNPKHPFYKKAKIQRWLAFKDSECVGRIAAVINEAHNEFHEDDVGFFGFFECINDEDVAHALLAQAQSYLKQHGKNVMRGPVNLSTNYECGLLVEGFDDPPQVMMTYNPSYYKDFFQSFGLEKSKDLLAYNMNTNFNLPEKVERVSQRLIQRNSIKVRTLNLKNWNQEVQTMYDIYNDAWEKNWGFVPMTKDEFFHTAKDLKQVVDPDLVIFVEVNSEPVGFIVGLPDLNQILKNIPNGKLLPFGIFKLLFGMKKIKRMRVITLGLKKKFQVKGLASVLITEIYKQVQKKKNIVESEFSWVLEDNYLMNRPIELLGAEKYKTYRIFDKEL